MFDFLIACVVGTMIFSSIFENSQPFIYVFIYLLMWLFSRLIRLLNILLSPSAGPYHLKLDFYDSSQSNISPASTELILKASSRLIFMKHCFHRVTPLLIKLIHWLLIICRGFASTLSLFHL